MPTHPLGRLAIAHTWDGQPLSPASTATLALSIDANHLYIDLDSPYFNDRPPPEVAGPTPGLWEHEVVELFVQGRISGPYTEVELGPHGHHLVLRLDGVREVRDQLHPIAFTAEVHGRRWTGRAAVPLALLPSGPWRGNAFAIHGPADARIYSAWAPVPGAQPDFHQPACFRRFDRVALPPRRPRP